MSTFPYKKQFYRAWDRIFPQLSEEDDDFIRRAYKGGWTYVNPIHQEKDLKGISVYDVNSMYPDKMRNYKLPIGRPFYRDKPFPGELYVVEFDAAFSIKPGHFPSVQVKGSFRNTEAEYLTDSAGFVHLSMTSIDYEVFHEQYDIIAEQNHTYMCFRDDLGESVYKDYIDFWMKKKEECSRIGDKKGKAIAKRFLNSLYGKTGENPKKLSKTAHLDDNGVIRWTTIETEGKGFYLPHATFITAYARAQIIRSAQLFGDKFVYADTDSVHVLTDPRDTRGLKIHPSKLGYWKLESVSFKGRYLRPKCYMHIMEFDIKSLSPLRIKGHTPIEIKAGGAPSDCKQEMTWDNFQKGAVYEHKLMSKQVPGGTCLIDTTYSIKL